MSMQALTPTLFADEVIALITTKGPQMNFGLNTKEPQECVLANREALQESLHNLPINSCVQEHGDEIFVVTERDRNRGWLEPELLPKGFDALITNKKGVILCVLLADCAGVLLHDPKKGAVAAVHSGWKGSAKKIVKKTIRALGEIYGSEPEDIRAYVSPAIRSCCYEIREDVAERFAKYPFAIERIDGKIYLDIPTIITVDMLEAGLREAHIEMSTECTCCSDRRFFSYRREKESAGRFAAMIGIV